MNKFTSAIIILLLFVFLSPPIPAPKAATKGRIAEGMDADLVVLDADPAQDVGNFAKVAYTIKGGKVIFQARALGNRQ